MYEIIRFKQIPNLCCFFFVRGHVRAHSAAPSAVHPRKLTEVALKRNARNRNPGDGKFEGKKKWKKLEISQKEPHKRIYATCMKEYGRRKRRMRARRRWLDLGHKLTLTYAESHTQTRTVAD